MSATIHGCNYVSIIDAVPSGKLNNIMKSMTSATRLGLHDTSHPEFMHQLFL
jgi:hypothetical protein